VSCAPELAPKLAEAIAALEADGIALTPAEVAWLARLRWPCDNPEDGSIQWVAGAPVVCCGVTFWPLTMRATAFWARACQLFGADSETAMQAYLMAHVYSEPGDRTLMPLSTEDEIATACDYFEASLPIPEAQLGQLYRRLIELGGGSLDDPGCEESGEDVPSVDLPSFAAAMCRAFPGTTPDYWLDGISKQEAAAMESRAVGESGEWATGRRRTNAMRAFMRAVKAIRRDRQCQS